MKCPFCKEEIQEGAIKCKHCGSMLSSQEVFQTAATPTTAGKVIYTDYSQVPFHRKNWFAILVGLFLPLGCFALLFIVFTGDIYYKRRGELRKYGKVSKVILLIISFFGLLWFFSSIL